MTTTERNEASAFSTLTFIQTQIALLHRAIRTLESADAQVNQGIVDLGNLLSDADQATGDIQARILEVQGHRAMMHPEPTKNACPICEKGYLISTRDDGRRAVERCDACFLFADDEAAAVAAKADGVNCELRYPCYLIE